MANPQSYLSDDGMPPPKPLTDVEIYTIIRQNILKSDRRPDVSKENVRRVIDAYLAAEEAEKREEPVSHRLTDAEIYTIVRNAILRSGRKRDFSKEEVQAMYAAYLAEEAAKEAEQNKGSDAPS